MHELPTNRLRTLLAPAALTALALALLRTAPAIAEVKNPVNTTSKCVCACDVPKIGAEKLIYFTDSFNCGSPTGKACSYEDSNGIRRHGKMAQCGKNLNYKEASLSSPGMSPTGGPTLPKRGESQLGSALQRLPN